MFVLVKGIYPVYALKYVGSKELFTCPKVEEKGYNLTYAG